MSNSSNCNIFEPLMKSLLECSKLTINLLFKTNQKLSKDNLDDFFLSIGLENRNNKNKPIYISTLEDSQKILKIVLDNSKTMFNLAEFQEKEESFLNYFNMKKAVFEHDYSRNIIITMYKELMKNNYNYKTMKADTPTLFFLGYDELENEIWGDLSKHAMIGGSTGFGKSSFLSSLILNKLYENKTNSIKIRFKLIDLKAVEFNVFENIQYVEIAQDVESTISIINEVKKEIEQRKKLFSRLKVKNLEEYNNNSSIKLDYIFVLIDEYACFQEMIECKQTKEKVLSDLRQVSSICRSFGIKLIVASQKTGVTAGAMDSFFRSQISSNMIIGFKVQDDNTSKTIIFDSGLEKLEREGESICVLKGRKHHIQTMYLSEKELKSRLKKDFQT